MNEYNKNEITRVQQIERDGLIETVKKRLNIDVPTGLIETTFNEEMVRLMGLLDDLDETNKLLNIVMAPIKKDIESGRPFNKMTGLSQIIEQKNSLIDKKRMINQDIFKIKDKVISYQLKQTEKENASGTEALIQAIVALSKGNFSANKTIDATVVEGEENMFEADLEQIEDARKQLDEMEF